MRRRDGVSGNGAAQALVTTNDSFDLSGRRAVVTGAARGIGRASAAALARHGAEVVLVDVLEDLLESTADELASTGLRAHARVADVRSDDDVRGLADLLEALGGVDVVVNGAGVIRRAASIDASVQDLECVWEVNVRGLYAVTQALLPQLVERRAGKIINVGSLGSILGLPDRAAYAATKGAVRQYTQSLAVDLGAYGICVNAIAPGYIETDMTQPLLSRDERERERMLERIPLGRFGLPADLQGAFVFLAAPASDYLTGQIIVVDGGWSSW